MNIKPDWHQIALKIGESGSHDSLHSAWGVECQRWLNAVSEQFGSDYRVEESPNFSIMSNESPRYIKVFSEFLESKLKQIVRTLDGIASDKGYGKHVAMIFQDIDQYYEYVDMFFPDEGEFGLSSGMYINEGYGHFVFPSQDIDMAEPIAVHELTHACLAHLPIPLWLNEGLAVLMEEVLAGNTLYIDKKVVTRHQNYWNKQTIQDFWSGDSFYSSDEGQRLSYHLAHILTRNISQDYLAFSQFVNNANFEDAGSAASIKYLDYSLEQIVGSFLGEGDWHVDLQLNNMTKMMPSHII